MARLAKQHFQNGWVANTTDGVCISIEGLPDNQAQFLNDLKNRLPPFAKIQSISISQEALVGYNDFQIQTSIIDSKRSIFLLPDIATCTDCLHDIFDKQSRFYRYPFTSCCNCGPRYSIIHSQPFDRVRTAMTAFKPCEECEADYGSIENRRFHAQTIACPKCGPQLRLLDRDGRVLAEKALALTTAIQQLREGKIIALKGIGGFQLLVDANQEKAIERLRHRKHRPKKPFAIMVSDMANANKLCLISEEERVALFSYAAPIVLLQQQTIGLNVVSKAVAPDTNLLGILLPYSPLHHLILREFDGPLVVTSGNRQDEPLCIDDEQALDRLKDIADVFLTHNRPILRPLDDSIVRTINGKTTVLRRARGYSSLPISLNTGDLSEMIAVGGQLKSTVAVCQDNHAILSQHLGDLDSEASQQQFQNTLADLQQLYQIKKTERVLRDLHPGYVSSRSAENLLGIKTAVQHHYAHALACMAEHRLEPPVLGIVWDGSGLGDDLTLWGGEFLSITAQGYQRLGHLRSFALPGGTNAIKEPRRAALGLLYEIYANHVFNLPDLGFTTEELNLLKSALKKQINCPQTTSAGRIFDAVASLLGLCQINEYEGYAAMMLENTASCSVSDQFYPFNLNTGKTIVVDWQETFEQILEDRSLGFSLALIATKFHNTLAEMMLAVAKSAEQKTIVLSGGCFQNALLVEKTVHSLKNAGFTVYCHEKIPPNDGGLALGQLVAANYLGH